MSSPYSPTTRGTTVDSKIREALKIVQTIKLYPYLGYDVHNLLDKAISLLAAEPEPCASALAVATRIEELSTSYRRREIRTKEEMYARSAELIDAYASRREQEAREDGRRRFEPIMGKIDEALGSEDWNEVKSAWCDLDAIINPDQSAILQGTEPAEYVESKEDRDERLRVKQELGAGCHDEMRYNEPAKVSEDVALPKCDHRGAIACGTDCDGSSHYTPEKKE